MLYILRHAEAEPGCPDELRPLTAKGWKQARAIGSFLAKQPKCTPEKILHSGLTRAKSTALGVLEEWGKDLPLEELPILAPNQPIDPISRKIKTFSHSVLLVGHNPHLTLLMGEMISLGAHESPVHVRKASLWAFSPCTLSPSPWTWQLEWSIYADQIIHSL
jgi:phosphohistidine phosphatase